MALTKPTLLSQVAFDATKSQEIGFVVSGGSQVVKNRLKIIDNETGLDVYDVTQESFKTVHVILPDSLTNGKYYQATLQTLDKDNNESPWSNSIQFYCYSDPTLTITNIPLTNIIDNSNFSFEALYEQAEDEKLNSYKYILYDNLGIEIANSGVKYANSETILTYVFKGLEDKKDYRIEVEGVTVNGMSVTTGVISFTVSYTTPTIFAILNLENNCDKGNITITSNMVDIEGTGVPDPPIYIDGDKVDLTDDGSYVLWDNGFVINDNFALGIWGYDFQIGKELCLLWGTNLNNKISISLGYSSDMTMVYAQMYCYQGGRSYYCYSNYIPVMTNTDQIFIGVKRIDNIYGINIENKGEV